MDSNSNYKQIIYDYSKKYVKQKINWRIQISTEFSAKDRQELKDYIKSLDNTNNIQFSYIQNKQQNKEKHNYNNSISSVTMIQQLFQQFEKDKNIKLDKNIKTELDNL